MRRQFSGSLLFVVFITSVLPGTILAQTSPDAPLPGPTPGQPAIFEVNVRAVSTGYAVPAAITITPRIPEPPGEVGVRVPPDVFTGPPGRGEVFLRRDSPPVDLRTQEFPDGSEGNVPLAGSMGPTSPSEVLSEQSVTTALPEPIRPSSLTVRANMNGPTLIPLEPGVYDISVSAKNYEPGAAYFTIGPDIKPPRFIFGLTPHTLPDRLLPEVVTSKVAPGLFLFHGHVVDDFSGQPLAGVFVHLAESRVGAKTDKQGYFFSQVAVPQLTGRRPEDIPSDEIPPADDLIAELPGYKQYRLVKTLLYGQQFVIELERGIGITEINNPHRMLAPPVEEEAPSGLQEPVSSAESSSDRQSAAGRITPQVVDGSAQHAVRQILVGFNNCGSLGKTCTSVRPMSMEEYVRAGLNEEWTISWSKNSFKAGAVAYRTYAAHHCTSATSASRAGTLITTSVIPLSAKPTTSIIQVQSRTSTLQPSRKQEESSSL